VSGRVAELGAELGEEVSGSGGVGSGSRADLQESQQQGFEGTSRGGRADDAGPDDVEQPQEVVVGPKGRLTLDGGIKRGT
jgi:hypothetical protein